MFESLQSSHQVLDGIIVKKFLEVLEKAFAVFGIMFFAGVLFFGYGEGATMTSFVPTIVVTLIRYFIWGTAILLLCARWKSAFLVARTDPFFWILTVILMASPLWSDFPDWAIPASREILQMTCFGWYLASRFSIKEQMKLLGIALGVGALLSVAVIFAIPAAGTHTVDHAGAWRGVFVHKNEFGSRMVMAGMIAFLCATDRRPHRWGWLGLMGALILIVFSASRTALLYGLVMPSVIYLCRHFRWRGKSTVIALDFALLFIGGLISAVVLNWVALTASIGKSPDISGRFPMWGSIVSSVQERPWFGFGRSAFWAPDSPYALKAGLAVSDGFIPPNAHNGFLDLLTDVGWVGFVLFTISLLIALFRAFKLVAKTRDTAYIWAFTFLVFLIANNMTESLMLNLANMYWTFYIATALSLRDAELVVLEESRQTALSGALTGEQA